jgi:hypothetical protein
MADQAKAIGKEGQNLMEILSMDRVYDYMFHLITVYSKLQNFKPVPPSSALEVCPKSLLCLADDKQRQFLEKSTALPSQAPPCSLQTANSNLINGLIQQKKKSIKDVEDMEMLKVQRRSH